MKTHLVIDMVFAKTHVFVGTEKECYEWMEDQDDFGYRVVPMTVEELKIHNS